MKITWLGQAGLLLESGSTVILIDPYLSDSVGELQPHCHRREPVDERFLALKPDIIVLTHNHLDHTDPQTLQHYLSKDSAVCVLASGNAWDNVRGRFGGIGNNYVRFNRGTEWTEKGIRFRAVYAEHSDSCAIGIIITLDDKVLYVTGDTLYNEQIFCDLPEKIDAVFLPVNGVGNNMNMEDARRFCERIGAPAIPLHCGLFDEKDMHSFAYSKAVIPEFYKEILL